MTPRGEDMENIRLSGAKNIRDLGGIMVNGGVIKPHKLLRGSHLGSISDNDSGILAFEYELKTVIDLRTKTEKDEIPDIQMSGIEYLEMPIFDGSLPGLSHESKQDIDNIPDMRELYEYVMNSSCVDNLAAVVRKIVCEDNGGSYLYHCTEGKDRTGMITALLLTVLGADRRDILEDYLFTNTINKKKAQKYYFLVKYFKRNKTAADRVYNVFLAKEEYINEVFKAIDKIGEQEFIKDVIKLSDNDIEQFRKRTVAEM